jgi:hypothetical protein
MIGSIIIKSNVPLLGTFLIISNMVGVRGLEPPTSASRTLRASQLRHTAVEGYFNR